MNDVPGPLLPIETGFMRRCGCSEAAVHGVVQKNPEPAIAGGRSVSINEGHLTPPSTTERHPNPTFSGTERFVNASRPKVR